MANSVYFFKDTKGLTAIDVVAYYNKTPKDPMNVDVYFARKGVDALTHAKGIWDSSPERSANRVICSIFSDWTETTEEEFLKIRLSNAETDAWPTPSIPHLH